MRRTFAVAAVAAGVFAIAGCGSDGGGGGGEGGNNTVEVCNRVEATVDPLQTDLMSAIQDAALAAAEGDDAALDQSMTELDSVVGQINQAVRDGAAEADDPEFRAALENFATELEGLADSVESGSAADAQSFATASEELAAYCD